ncbi:MAG: DUF1302 family protein, partial [Gammaproteobacteria bacterium]
MKSKGLFEYPSHLFRTSCFLHTVIITSIFASPAHAIDFEKNDLYGSWDTTISIGQSSRTQDIDGRLIGLANGGTAFSNNGDNGNLNYRNGIFSTVGKFTTELELNYKNYGAFIRANGFMDVTNDDKGDRTPLSDKADRLVTENLNLLDAYAWGDFNIGEMPGQLRVGEQVISWGESTFIQNSINV